MKPTIKSIMELRAFRRESTEAECRLSCTEPARLNKYSILELARLPGVTREVVIEDQLEGVYGKPRHQQKYHQRDLDPREKQRTARTSSLRHLALTREELWLLARQLIQRRALCAMSIHCWWSEKLTNGGDGLLNRYDGNG